MEDSILSESSRGQSPQINLQNQHSPNQSPNMFLVEINIQANSKIFIEMYRTRASMINEQGWRIYIA